MYSHYNLQLDPICAVPILSIEKQFHEIVSVKILPREPQAFCTLSGQELWIFRL